MVAREGKSWEVWSLHLDSLKPTSRAGYVKNFEEFLVDHGWGYDEFFDLYLAAVRSGDPRDLQMMVTKIINYFKSKKTVMAPGSANRYLVAIRSFLNKNGLPFVYTGNRKDLSIENVRDRDSFTPEELRHVVEAAPHVRTRALILSGKDSGLRESDLASLRVYHVHDALENGEKFMMLAEPDGKPLKQFKTKGRVYPCLGFEALNEIENWLNWRRAKGFTVAPSSPLFIKIEVFGVERRGTKWSERAEPLKKGIPMTAPNIKQAIMWALDNAGIPDKYLVPHSLRIFCQSQLEAAGLNKNIVYRLIGRKISDSGKSYSKGELLQSFIKAYPYLTIGPKPLVVEVGVEGLNNVKTELDDTKRALREMEWLLGDPEVSAILKRMIEERKQR